MWQKIKCWLGWHEWGEYHHICISKYNWWYDRKCMCCGKWDRDYWDDEEQKIKWESVNIVER